MNMQIDRWSPWKPLSNVYTQLRQVSSAFYGGKKYHSVNELRLEHKALSILNLIYGASGNLLIDAFEVNRFFPDINKFFRYRYH